MIRNVTITILFFAIAAYAAPCNAQPSSEKHEGTKESITNTIGMQLVPNPAGKFKMRSPLTEPERVVEEVPHEVSITQAFLMGVHEVTQEEFHRVVGDKPTARFAGHSDE